MSIPAHNLESGFITQVVNELFAINSDVQIVLRGHLYCESSLLRRVRSRLHSPEYFDGYRGGFANLLMFAAALGCLPDSIYRSLSALNDLRNSVAHRLDFKIDVNESRNFANTIKGSVGADNLGVDITRATNWYFDNCQTASIALRRGVFWVWAIMEIEYALTCDGLLVGDWVTEVISELKNANASQDPELIRAVELLSRLTPKLRISSWMRQAILDS